MILRGRSCGSLRSRAGPCAVVRVCAGPCAVVRVRAQYGKLPHRVGHFAAVIFIQSGARGGGAGMIATVSAYSTGMSFSRPDLKKIKRYIPINFNRFSYILGITIKNSEYIGFLLKMLQKFCEGVLSSHMPLHVQAGPISTSICIVRHELLAGDAAAI